MTEHADAMERYEAKFVYAVVAQGRLGVDHDVLAVYATPERAQELIDAQDDQLRSCLVIWDIELNKHPSDEYWAKPKGMVAAFHALADIPVDALAEVRPTAGKERVAAASERVKLGALMSSIAREAGDLTDAEAKHFDSRDRVDDLERGCAETLDWICETVTTKSPEAAIDAIRRRLGVKP